MPRDPGSVWSPLVEWNDQGSYPKDKFIVHSTGDRASAARIAAYFGRPDIGVESTFVVGTGPEDPTLQIMDSSARADANVAANRSGISVEVVGTGDDPYTDWQVSEIIRIGRWAHEAHGIPHQVIPHPDKGGYGWHVMFGAPGPWTSVAKVCPGGKRIAALKDTILPAIFGAPKPQPKPTPGPTPKQLGSRVLRKGDFGTDVSLLQKKLAHDYPLYAKHLDDDGIFGKITEGVVKEFQRRSKITVDGVVGPQTYRALGVT